MNKRNPVSPGMKGASPPSPPTYVTLRKRLLSTKTLITVGSLTAVFVLAGIGRDVKQLEVIIPAILLFYNAANVTQDVMNKKTEAKKESENGA